MYNCKTNFNKKNVEPRSKKIQKKTDDVGDE